MRSPYNENEYAKCAGCFMEIYYGEEFLETSTHQKVHDEFGCLVNAVGAVETLDKPKKELYCEGCTLDILPEHAPYLQFTWGVKTVCVHNDFDCLRSAVDARRYEAGRKLREVI